MTIMLPSSARRMSPERCRSPKQQSTTKEEICEGLYHYRTQETRIDIIVIDMTDKLKYDLVTFEGSTIEESI